MSHSTDKLRRGNLLCSRKILVSKSVRDKREGEYHNFPLNFFCFTVPKIFVGEPFSVSLISGIENFYDSERYVTSSDFLLKFYVSQCPNFRRGVLYCCINFGYQKSLDKGDGCQDFPSDFFCLTMPKVSVGESFTVALISGTGKVSIRRGSEYQDFPSEIFFLTVWKKFVGEPFCLPEKFWCRKMLVTREGAKITISHRYFLSHCAEKFRRGIL